MASNSASQITQAQTKARQWLADPQLTPAMIAAIQALLADKNPQALLEAFADDIHFGTGGLRAEMGIGSARMNAYTIRTVSKGLAQYLHQHHHDKTIHAVIGYDSRLHSAQFAQITAETLCDYGIHVYLFEALRPTPLLSFAIRHLHSQCGVVITASHNPKSYNGYKVFGDDGAQLTHPQDQQVMACVQQVQNSVTATSTHTYPKASIRALNKEIDEAYLEALDKQHQALGLSFPHEPQTSSTNLEIVYSPLHGTGITLVPKILENSKHVTLHVVKEQAVPDGNFPTVTCPNPEEPQAMQLAIEKARQENAALVLATDPDSDRVGVAIQDTRGSFQLLSGHQVAALLTDYVLRHVCAKKQQHIHPFIVKTVVTTELVAKIAAAYGLHCYNTPTGFKYIAALIREQEAHRPFVLGVEESCGYLLGDFVRDKDALGACLGIVKMAYQARQEGKNLLEKLEALYSRYGWHEERLISISKKGAQGMQEIKDCMTRMRSHPPQQLGGKPLKSFIDYAEKTSQEPHTKSTHAAGRKLTHDSPTDTTINPRERTTRPFSWSSNMLSFQTTNSIRLIIRPSGTEPKIKCYLSVYEPPGQNLKQQSICVKEKIQALEQEVLAML